MTDRHGWIFGREQEGTMKESFAPSHIQSINVSNRIGLFAGVPIFLGKLEIQMDLKYLETHRKIRENVEKLVLM